MEYYNQALPKDLSHENRLQCDFTYWTREIRVNRNDANAYKELFLMEAVNCYQQSFAHSC